MVTVDGNLTVTTNANNGSTTLNDLAVDGTIGLNTHGTGSATVVNDAGLQFASSTVGGNLHATATTGNMTQSGALDIEGTTTLITSADDATITLGTTSNAFTGALLITTNDSGTDTAGDVSVHGGTTALVIGDSTVDGDLTLTSTATGAAAIADTGRLNIRGITTVSASGVNVTLNTTTNNFQGAVKIGGVNVTVVDAGAIDLGASTVSGTYTLTAGGSVTDSGALAITGVTTIDASSGNVTLNTTTNNFQGAVKIDGVNVTVVDAGAIDLGASTVSGTYTVTATSGGGITNTGVLAITNGATFKVDGGQSISLNQANTFSSTVTFTPLSGTITAVTIRDSNDFELKALTTTGGLTVTAGGAVTNSGTLVIPGTTTISASGQAVTLGDSSNNFGTTTITGANVAITDTNAIILGASTVSGTYSVTAGGAVTNSGTQEITGVTTISASGHNVTLDTATNNFANEVRITGAAVTVVDEDAINLGASTVSGTYSVTAGGAVTQSGALAITGATTISASGHNVTLNTATNNFQGAVGITGATVAVVDAGAIDLGASAVSGTYTVTATSGGDITDSGVLAITNGATFKVADGRSIILNQASTFSSTVTFIPLSGTLAVVTINDSNAFDLKALTLTGDLNVTAGGAVTQSGALAITGATTISASGHNVTLNTATNNFQEAVGITGATVAVVDAGAIALGASTVSGTYTVTATSGGGITDRGVLTITNGATFKVDSGRSIILNNNNTFSSTVTFTPLSGTITAVTIKDSNDFDLKALTTTGNLKVTAGGAVTNSGTLVIPGTTTISASGQAVTLGDSSNNFGTTAITGANVAITDTNAIVLGAATVSGTYSVTAGGAVTNSDTQEITGVTTISASGHNVTLDTATNNFANEVRITGAAVTVVDEDAINLGASTVSGAYSVTAGGAVTNSGTQEITGVTTISASGHNVTLDTATNNFANEVRITGAAVTVVDEDAIDLGASTVSGTYTVTAGGAVTDSGTQEIAGVTTISASGQDVTLNTATNNFAGEVRITGAAVTVVDEDAIVLGASIVSGTYDLTAAGAITESGDLSIAGVTTLVAGGNDITLNRAGNNFQAAVIITSGRNVTLVDAGAIDLGASTVTGTYAVTATAGGDITDSGVLTITGAATFTAANGQSIYLDGANTFSNTVAFSSGGTLANVTIRDSNDFDLSALTLSGNLIATSTGGSITDSGALAITGVTTIDASSGNVTLNMTTNNFQGAVKIRGVNVTVVDAGAIDLGASTVTGTYAVTATAGGDITDSGVLAITGTSAFTVGGGRNITLDQYSTFQILW